MSFYVWWLIAALWALECQIISMSYNLGKLRDDVRELRKDKR